MTDADKILELMHDGDSAEAIMRKILADRERLIECVTKLSNVIVKITCEGCGTTSEQRRIVRPAIEVLEQSAQTNDEILGERE